MMFAAHMHDFISSWDPHDVGLERTVGYSELPPGPLHFLSLKACTLSGSSWRTFFYLESYMERQHLRECFSD